MRRIPLLVPAVLAAALAVGCSSSSTTSTGDLDGKTLDKETGKSAVTIDAADNVFQAPYTEISKGTTVTFKNAGRNEHNVISVGEGFTNSKLLQPGDTYEVTFEDGGDFQFYCSLHGTQTSGMTGGVRVKS